VEVPPRMKATITREDAVVTILFNGTKLLVLAAFPREQKVHHNYFLAMIVLSLSKKI
jgi:hypothetical protein